MKSKIIIQYNLDKNMPKAKKIESRKKEGRVEEKEVLIDDEEEKVDPDIVLGDDLMSEDEEEEEESLDDEELNPFKDKWEE